MPGSPPGSAKEHRHRSATQSSRGAKERRSSDRHRPHRGRNAQPPHDAAPTEQRHPHQERQSSRQRKGAQAQERDAVLPVGQRSAGLQTGIARTAGETPIPNPHMTHRAKGWATPPTPGAPGRERRHRSATPQDRTTIRKGALRQTGSGWRNSHRPTPLHDAPRQGMAQRHPHHTVLPWGKGAPVFRPASPAPRAKLPSPNPP